ncbi:hypothetical protein [Pseudoduganella lutea]|uniref:Uncharacterized protein n=1 Tax=Pseudoduganella lutea TaxID=321985 RepID=A0A4P6KYH8_9BURK|nr:hypothetical protein [Pseudoduganella lutea]QBE64259.1 hypothetical protein EWM63_15730 [Pseudoduganella lutea]
MKLMTIMLASCLIAGCGDNNEDFGKKVQRHMAENAKDEQARQEAVNLCRPLSEERRSEEPRCVALQQEARGNMYKVPPPSDRSKDKGW